MRHQRQEVSFTLLKSELQKPAVFTTNLQFASQKFNHARLTKALRLIFNWNVKL